MGYCDNEHRKIDKNFENPIDLLIIDSIEFIDKNVIKLQTDPNFITIFRFILVVIFWSKFNNNKTKTNATFFAFIFLLGYYLDCLDGYLARKCDSVTKFGDYLDHIADLLSGVLILSTLYPFKNWELISAIASTFLGAAYMGCQQKIYNNSNEIKETLDYFKPLCFCSITKLKYFTTATTSLVFVGLFLNRYVFKILE